MLFVSFVVQKDHGFRFVGLAGVTAPFSERARSSRGFGGLSTQGEAT